MEETKRIFSKIEDALEDFKSGRIVIVVDDADRENEGDFVCAAQCITKDTVNFIAAVGCFALPWHPRFATAWHCR